MLRRFGPKRWRKRKSLEEIKIKNEEKKTCFTQQLELNLL